jgi:hypothetical protein
MATMRNLCSTLFLVPLSLLASHAAGARGEGAPAVAAHFSPLASLPEGIHRTVSGRYTRDMCDHKRRFHCLSQILLPEDWTPDQAVPKSPQGGGTASGMGPTDILTAYNIPSSSSAGGKIVAVLDGPDSNAYSDLSAYRSAYGLPSLPRCSGAPTGTSPCFLQVSETGGTASGDSGASGDSETALDMDMISAACPDCSILLVGCGTAQGPTDSDFITAAATAKQMGAVAISISFGGVEGGSGSGADPTGYTTAGHLVLAASGDYGYNNVDMGEGVLSPSYPSSAPDVIAVGGTSLYYNGGSSYDEAVWNDGKFTTSAAGQDVMTNGCSKEFAMPSWQAAGLAGTSCTLRATADIAAAATFFSGGGETAIDCYVGSQGGMVPVEGTSAASPMMAAILTRLGLAEKIADSIAQGSNWIYANPSGFNDLGSSSYPVHVGGPTSDAANPATCGKLCTVGTGWDGPSGMGTPNGTALAALAAGGTPPSSGGGSSSSASTPPSSGSGASSPPPASSGTGSSTPAQGNDAGGGPVTTATGLGIGLPCAALSDCASNLCGSTVGGIGNVCTQTCSALAPCPSGFGCTSGYCFEDDAPGQPGYLGGNHGGGCAVSSRGTSAWGLVGGLSLGLVGLVSRRRRSRAG